MTSVVQPFSTIGWAQNINCYLIFFSLTIMKRVEREREVRETAYSGVMTAFYF